MLPFRGSISCMMWWREDLNLQQAHFHLKPDLQRCSTFFGISITRLCANCLSLILQSRYWLKLVRKGACSFLSLPPWLHHACVTSTNRNLSSKQLVPVWELLTVLGHGFIWLQPFVMRHIHTWTRLHKEASCGHCFHNALNGSIVCVIFTLVLLNKRQLYNMHTPACTPKTGPQSLALARWWIWKKLKFELCCNILQRSKISQRRTNLTQTEPILLPAMTRDTLKTHPFFF